MENKKMNNKNIDKRANQCKFNKYIDCVSQTECFACGWNPAVTMERKRAFKNEMAESIVEDSVSNCEPCTATEA